MEDPIPRATITQYEHLIVTPWEKNLPEKKKQPANMKALLVPAGRAAMLRCQYDLPSTVSLFLEAQGAYLTGRKRTVQRKMWPPSQRSLLLGQFGR